MSKQALLLFGLSFLLLRSTVSGLRQSESGRLLRGLEGANGEAMIIGEAVFISRSSLPDGLVQEEERDGTGANAPVGYCLVENQPKCYYTLGSSYCNPPAAGEAWTDRYMSHRERTSQVLTNAARMDPTGFKTIYFDVGSTYACTTSVQPPLRYSANGQQAATQLADILATTGCPFQHDTCSTDRVNKYEPNWWGLGENIAMTYLSAANEPSAALLQWLGSAGHCSNIYSAYSHMGTGQNGRYWSQDFITLYNDANTNPMYDGTHYVHATKTNGNIRWMVSFNAPTAPVSIKVTIGYDATNNWPHYLTLHLGSATQGVYAYDEAINPSSTGCLAYYFTVVTFNGKTYNLPETGAFNTYSIAGCTSNWGPDRNVPGVPPSSPSTAPPATSPTPATATPTTTAPIVPITSPPTKAPTRKPTSSPTLAPSTSPTKSPTTLPITSSPTPSPSNAPTKFPSSAPSLAPTLASTLAPTKLPTQLPTLSPSSPPTLAPSFAPSLTPATLVPTNLPTKQPAAPTIRPTKTPTKRPTKAPTNIPTKRPTLLK